MSIGFVADSSIAVSWAVQSQSTSATDRLMDEVFTGTSFIVPSLWVFEVANTLVMLIRRKRLQEEDIADALRILQRFAPIVDEDGRALAFREISDLARKYSLTVYDATYLELASRLRLPLASRDSALNKAARRAGVKILLDDR